MSDWILTSSVLILLLLFLRKVVGEKLPSGFLYGLWLLVLVRLLVPFSFFKSSFSLPQITDRAAERMRVGDQSLLFIVWICGMAVTALFFLAANLIFRFRLFRDRKEVEEEELKEAGLSSPVPVYVTERVRTPCLAGLKEPAVYLPETVWEKEKGEKLSGQKEGDVSALSCMICHEKVHYRHGDQLWGFLRLICLVLHWYNPLVWVAAFLSRQDGEAACDAGTIRLSGEESRYGYGSLLIAMTTESGGFEKASLRLRHAGIISTEMADTGKELERRIRKLAKPEKYSIRTMLPVLVICLLLFCFLFTGAEKAARKEYTGLVKVEKKDVSLEEAEEEQEAYIPSAQQTEAVREAALRGISEEEREALTVYIKDYHNWMEYRMLYENMEKRLSDKKNVYWNYFDEPGEIQTGWYLEEGYENYPEYGKISLEELGQKYGEPVMTENRYDVETVTGRLRGLTASVTNQAFADDVEALCSALEEGSREHDVKRIMYAHEILHDMDYFVLRYSPEDVAPYTTDKSLSGRYYGVLESMEN